MQANTVNDTRRSRATDFTPARPLTRRQRTILVCVVGGASYKAIAEKLGIAQRTVRQHVETIAMLLPGNGAPRHKVTVWAQVLLHHEAA
jgi:DNA-binding NarL/FixJ family response regulator